MKNLYTFLATGFNVGYLRGAPGTYGTVVGVAVYLLIYGLPAVSYIFFVVALTFLSVWIVAGALRYIEGNDPSSIVIDEIAGFLFSMMFVKFSLINLGLAFVLFRFFDIVKPPPIRQFERIFRGPWGVVIDDVIAGIFASIILLLINFIIN